MLEAAIIVKCLIAVPDKVSSYIDFTWIETAAYDTYDHHASSVVHSDVLSIASAVEPGTLAIRFAPYESGDFTIAAYLAHGTAVIVLREFNTVAKPGFADEIETRAKKHQQIWGTEADTAGVSVEDADEWGRLHHAASLPPAR